MTKTKKQLRAEAVERLKDAQTDNLDWMLLGNECPNWVNYDTLSYEKAVRERVADLLTDDDANDDLAHESDVRTVSVDANDVKVSTMPLKMPSEIRWHYTDGGEYTQELTGDSREKLEADAGELTANYAASGEVCDALHGGIIALLDRQAAITERECVRHHESLAQRMIRDGYEHEIWELEKRVKELTGERDELKEEIAKYEHDCGLLFDEKHKLTAERDKMQEQLRIGWECECRLQAERERYRSKFGKCLDYADAIHALMDDEGMA